MLTTINFVKSRGRLKHSVEENKYYYKKIVNIEYFMEHT